MMRKDSFVFTPRLLIVIVSNGDLALSAPDEALCERLRLLGGWKQIPAEDRLPELRSFAGPAILRRAVMDGGGRGRLPAAAP